MLWRALGYTVTCAVSHWLVSKAYHDACAPSWFGLPAAPLCHVLDKTLLALRVAPLLVLPAVQRPRLA